MTAMIIASKTGGCVEGDDCVSATDPGIYKTHPKHMRECLTPGPDSGIKTGELGTHLLLLLRHHMGLYLGTGRFLSYGTDGNSSATLEPATSAWLRYVFAV